MFRKFNRIFIKRAVAIVKSWQGEDLMNHND